MSRTPATAPVTNASNNATAVSGHPRNAPIIAASLISPPPMPPPLTTAIIRNNAPAPTATSADGTSRPCGMANSSPATSPG